MGALKDRIARLELDRDRPFETDHERRIKKSLLRDVHGLMQLTGNAAALKDLERVFGEYLEGRL